MGVPDRARMVTCRNQAGDMGHVHQQPGSHLVGNRPKPGKIDDARIGRSARDDQPGLLRNGQFLDLVIIDVTAGIEAVLDGAEPLAGLRGLGTVSQMAAGIEGHSEDRVAWVEQRELDGTICLRARVRLHICELDAKQLLQAVNGELFDLG